MWGSAAATKALQKALWRWYQNNKEEYTRKGWNMSYEINVGDDQVHKGQRLVIRFDAPYGCPKDINLIMQIDSAGWDYVCGGGDLFTCGPFMIGFTRNKKGPARLDDIFKEAS